MPWKNKELRTFIQDKIGNNLNNYENSLIKVLIFHK